MEGLLYKWTNYISLWKLRYFILKGSILSLYNNKGEHPKSRVHMSLVTINSSEDNLKFQIDTGNGIWYLKSQSNEEKQNWIRALKKAKFEANKNYNERKENNITNLNINVEQIKNIKNELNNEKNIFIPFSKSINLLEIIKNDIKTNNNQIKYLLEDSNSSKDKLIELLLKCQNENENKLEQFEKVFEDLKNNILKASKYFGRLTKYLEYNEENININPVNKAEAQAESIVAYKHKQPITNIIDNIDESIIITNDKEIFYEIEEMEPPLKQTEEIDLSIKLNNIETTEIKNKYFDPAYISNKRSSLPAQRKKLNTSFWKILKESIGKDLNKFSVPVYFNEPLSMLQKLCENFQYADLLNRASKEKNQFMRLALVGAFCIGGFALNPNRTLKFFNPLLGETYEYVDNDLNFRYFAEQVSHHPSISACYVEGDGYKFYANTNVESHFKLFNMTLEFIPVSKSYIIFDNFNNEQISYTKPVAAAKNLIGNVYIDCYGKFTVNNHMTGDYAEFEIFERRKDKMGQIKGEVKDMNGKIQLLIEGNILSHLDVLNLSINSRETIWKKFESDSEEKFFFTDFDLNLNYMNDELKNILPKTDSRFRPDQRALEMQNLEFAAEEKHRLEEKQRRNRRVMHSRGMEWIPIYFTETYDDLSCELIYSYSRDYWKDRKDRNFHHFPDIF